MGYAYRKRPVEIEAVQFVQREPDDCLTFENRGAPLPDWLLTAVARGDVYACLEGACVRTLEGEMRLQPGHFLIRGVKGELYSCDPEIFAMTYEPVEEAALVEAVAA